MESILPSFVTLSRPATSLISTRCAGLARRNAMIGTRLCPPARTRPSFGATSARILSASSRVFGRCRTKGADFMRCTFRRRQLNYLCANDKARFWIVKRVNAFPQAPLVHERGAGFQGGFRLIHHRCDDLGGGPAIIDEADRLAGNRRQNFQIAALTGLSVLLFQQPELLARFSFTVGPFVCDTVFHHAERKLLGPCHAAQMVDGGRANGLVTIRRDGARNHLRRSEGFGGRPETGPDQNSVGAKHQARCQAAAVSDSAGCEQQNFRGVLFEIVFYFWHERQRCTAASVAACFGALRNDRHCS